MRVLVPKNRFCKSSCSWCHLKCFGKHHVGQQQWRFLSLFSVPIQCTCITTSITIHYKLLCCSSFCWRVVLWGLTLFVFMQETGVGKSSIVWRFVEDSFDPNINPTIGWAAAVWLNMYPLHCNSWLISFFCFFLKTRWRKHMLVDELTWKK